jgi:hypothetical protein
MNTLDGILAKHKTRKSKMKYLDALWYLYVTKNPKIPGLEKILLNAIKKVDRESKDGHLRGPGTQGGGIYDIGKSLISGRSDYPTDQKHIIQKYGDIGIRSIRIGRTPLPSAINSVLNIVTLGAFQKLVKQSPYDKLFHLFSIIELDNGTKILLEKNEAINMKVVSSYNPPNTEYAESTYIPSELTFKELLDNGQKIQGAKWFKYNGTSNNCQLFIIAVLKGSSILTPELQDFIQQDVKTIFQTLPITKKIMNTVTGLGAVVDIIQKGGKIFKDIP